VFQDSYESDSEDDMAVDMDDMAEGLDFTILYTTVDEVHNCYSVILY
jgi:hypothetical protein